VSTFCAEHGISRKTFYAIRARTKAEGQAAVLEPRSRRPLTSPARINDEVRQQAVAVRAVLESSGLDHGPISVHDKMAALGLPVVPSVASLARIFRQAGVARVEPRKKPRAAYRRFVYPAPNACWQLDATEYVLAGGRKVVVFQLQDDHSRLAVASLAADGETSPAAVEVFKKGVAAHGIPQRLLTDNGAALNPSRRGMEGQLVTYVTNLGVQAITGKPYKPTTQGKNERFHQTLFRWLDKQPLAATITELQAQVDAFDLIYNTQRPHQGLPGRITPQQAWDATPVAEAPRPRVPEPRQHILDPATGAPITPPALEGLTPRKVRSSGTIEIRGVTYQIARELAGATIYVERRSQGVRFFAHNGDLLLEHPWPPPGTRHVSNGRARGSGNQHPHGLVATLRAANTAPHTEHTDHHVTVRYDGRVRIHNVTYHLDRKRAGQSVYVLHHDTTITFWDTTTGELIIEHPNPQPGTRYVGNTGRTRTPKPKPSPMS
jgi:transposase InsO family protein